MFCTKCGSELESGVKYCDLCWVAVENKTYLQDVNWMKMAGYLWQIVKNILIVLIIIGIYDSIYDSFEIIVVSLLIVIYCDIRGFLMLYGITNLSFIVWLSEEFKKVRVLLKEIPNEYEEDERQRLKVMNQKNMPKFYINVGFLLLIFLIAIVNLLGAL